jgi:hypothetical protein
MKLRIKGVPPGRYTALFESVKETVHDDFGAGLAWHFVILGGQFDGQAVQRTTPREPTPKNGCGKMLKAIAGSLPSAGVEVDLAQFFGTKYSIVVEEATNGGTRVGAVIPLRDENG